MVSDGAISDAPSLRNLAGMLSGPQGLLALVSVHDKHEQIGAPHSFCICTRGTLRKLLGTAFTCIYFST